MKVLGDRFRHWFITSFNTPVLEKSRLQWVDYLRGIAIVLVVYRHALLGIERSNISVPQILEDANMSFYSFRMPLFFVLSGIFISRSLAKRSIKSLVGIKFENLLYPYLIWTFIQVSLQIIFGHFTNSDRGLIDYTYILYHPRNLDQFWYLPALFNTSVIFLWIQSRFKPAMFTHLLLALALYYLSPYFQRVSMMSDWMEFYIFLVIGSSVSDFFFLKTSQQFFTSARGFLLVIPLFIAAQLYYLRHNIGDITLLTDMELIKKNWLHHMGTQSVFLLIAMVGCVTMFNLAFLLHRFKVFPFLRLLGYHSLQIYVMHVIVTGFIRLIVPPVLGINDPTLLLLFGITFGIVVPIVVYNLMIKDRIFWFLFTYKKKEKTQQSVSDRQSASVPSTIKVSSSK